MSFDYKSIQLPVAEVIPQVLQKLENETNLILKAPPGAGKSTLVPLALLDQAWLAGKKIYMLEPRRLAARSIANRMADLLGEKVGETVGYRVRFDNKIGPNTKIEVLTEGILTRIIQQDNALEDVAIVIFDEFHERSIHADVAMALSRECQQVLRPDLRLLVMSATLDMTELSTKLNASEVVSAGKQYPVEVRYSDSMETDFRMIPELTARTILKAVKENEGDTLVFLPGQGEIKKCEELLKRELKDFSICPLYGQLPQPVQNRAITPDRNGKRKVVLATSIAETSLTIEGIKVVVDCGFGRSQRFDPKSGLSRLETVRISQDSADQRAGRAGRLSAGVCYRMWTLATQSRLQEHRTPEIMEADLASLVLDMAQWGIKDAKQLTWLTPPPKAALAQASDLLQQLEALEDGKITEHGMAVHRLPCHPRIAHMLLKAEEDDRVELAADIAAVLEERDPLPQGSGIDINIRIEALRRFRSGNGGTGRFKQIVKVAESYLRLFELEAENDAFDPYETGVLLAHAYPERIAHARPGNNARFQLSNGKHAAASHKDDLAHEAWLSIAHLDAREGDGKIFMASPLNPRDLAPLVKTKEIITWDTRLGGLIASKDLRIGSIVLQSTPLPDPDETHLLQAICNAIKKEGSRLLDFNEDVEQWQNRIISLSKWRTAENWPDVSTESLLLSNEEWLKPYLNNVKTPEDLKKLNLKEILQYSLAPELQEKVNKLAPENIEVPSGSSVKLHYRNNGDVPVLAVRLQECFGLADTPKVNEGKTGVLMHLLSPGFKPVQVTSDLKSFWENTYFEVRKALKRRYPKHSWPDDPWTAEAVRGVKRRG